MQSNVNLLEKQYIKHSAWFAPYDTGMCMGGQANHNLKFRH